jgi:hypothetical protein
MLLLAETIGGPYVPIEAAGTCPMVTETACCRKLDALPPLGVGATAFTQVIPYCDDL